MYISEITLLSAIAFFSMALFRVGTISFVLLSGGVLERKGCEYLCVPHHSASSVVKIYKI